jgi:hypothetical protein
MLVSLDRVRGVKSRLVVLKAAGRGRSGGCPNAFFSFSIIALKAMRYDRGTVFL